MKQQSLRLRWPRTPQSVHLETGREGEEAARQHLSRMGYRILACNARIGPHDEVDLIAFDPADGVLVFVEVKTRSRSDPDYRPDLNMTAAKRTAMSRAARRWVAENAWEGGYRMDAVFVVAGKVREHVRELAWPRSAPGAAGF